MAWTAISYAAYSDLDFAFRSSLIGWLVCAAVWVAGQVSFAKLVKLGKVSQEQKTPNRHRLAAAGVMVGILVLAVLTAQWLGKRDKGAAEDFSTALRPETEPAATKQKSPAGDQSKAGSTDTLKTSGLWSVQVAAFRSEEAAVQLATVLKKRGWEAYVTSADVNAVAWYRTNVGRFRTREAAERLLLKLKDKEAYTTAFVASM